MNRTDTITTAARYGVREDNPLSDAKVTHEDVDHSVTVGLADKDLVSIDRLRLLTDPGFPALEVSYVYGTLRDGRKVRVDLGAYSIPKRGYKAALIGLAKDAGRYAKGLGMLDDDVVSILWG